MLQMIKGAKVPAAEQLKEGGEVHDLSAAGGHDRVHDLHEHIPEGGEFTAAEHIKCGEMLCIVLLSAVEVQAECGFFGQVEEVRVLMRMLMDAHLI